MIVKYFAAAVGFITLIVLYSALLSLPVMWLWDAIMPDIFGLNTITWLQAWGLSLLCGMLFKSHTTVNKD
jgi:hypothetical protein